VNRKVLIYALTSSKRLAQQVAFNLGLPLAPVEVLHFADGEIMVRSLESVRDANVYIIQSTCPPVTENLMEVLIFTDALKRSSAHEINVVIPYFGYARQDRMARPREPITAKLIADLLTAAGIKRIITVDIHTLQIQGFFSVPVEIMSVLPVFGHHIRSRLESEGIRLDQVVVVSPDHGSALRARDLASLLPNSRFALVDKRRPAPNKAEVSSLIGDVKDKIAIIVDDIVDTGGTMIAASHLIKAEGAKKIYAYATHGVFSRDAIELIKKSPIDLLTITDCIERDSLEGVEVISVAPMLAQVIDHIEKGLPISPIYDSYNL
jgi:ribose-phosphate pyrophosphokinase